METVEFPMEGGGRLLVRTEGGADDVLTRGGLEDILERADQTFESALGTISLVAQGVLHQLEALSRTPDQVEVHFGLELTAKAGAILAAAGATAQLQVTFTWKADAVTK